MCGFRWIPACLFYLLAVDTSLSTLDFYRTSGDTVILPFANRLPGGDPGCESTTWIHSQQVSATAVTVAENGVIQTSRLQPSKATRMSLETNCSLTVKNVAAEDVGYYVCRQFQNGRQLGGDQRVSLSVLAVREVTRGHGGGTEGRTLQCSLFGYDASCGRLGVSWTDKDGTLLADNSDPPGCSANLTVHTHHLTRKVRCQVTVSGGVKTFVDFPEVAEGDMMTTATQTSHGSRGTVDPTPATQTSHGSRGTVDPTPACSERLHGLVLGVRVVGTAVMVGLGVTLLLVSRRRKTRTPRDTDPLNAVAQV